MSNSEEFKREAIKESIKVNMDLIRLLTITIIATAGGFVSLVTRKDPSFIIDLIIAGAMFLLIIFVVLLIILVTRNLRLLKQLRDV